jgi:hypothetical protein
MLPKIKKQYTKFKTPITNIDVNVSKITLKDQKLMKEINNDNMLNVIVKIIESCTDADVSKLNVIEISWLFLQIRGLSLGYDVNVSAKCSNCGSTSETTIDLNKFEVTAPEKMNSQIELTDNIGIYLKTPNINDVMTLNFTDEIALFRSVIDYIYDDVDVYKPIDVSDSDLSEFMDSLESDKLNLILEWVKNTGSITTTHSWNCESCGHVNKITADGIKEFVS